MILKSIMKDNDALFTTPALLSSVLQEIHENNSIPVNPEIVVIDQADTLFTYS